MSLLELVGRVDGFWQAFAPAFYQRQVPTGTARRRRGGSLSASERMTTLIHFPQAHFGTFKAY